MTGRKLPPGPRGRELLFVVRQRRRDPLRLYLDLAARHGDVLYFKAGTAGFCLLNDAGHVRHVLAENHRNYTKGPGYRRLRAIIGNGLLTSEGEDWRRQRRLCQPAFHRDQLHLFSGAIARAARSRVESWSGIAPRELDIAAEMMALTLEVVETTLLGSQSSERGGLVQPAVLEMLSYIDSQGFNLFRLLDMLPGVGRWEPGRRLENLFPSPALRRFRRAVALLDEMVGNMIGARPSGPVLRAAEAGPPGKDILSLLAAARDGEGPRTHPAGGLSERELQDQVRTIFLAGHETTATALAWTLYLLGRNPAAEQRARQEVLEVAGQSLPDHHHLARLDFTRRVFKEALRLYPPFWRISRQAIRDDEIGGYRIPAGTTVICSPYLLHRNPRYFHNPSGFDPDRFLPDGDAQRPAMAYFPFGAGPRGCIGGAFAEMEALIILATVLQNGSLWLSPHQEIALHPHITLRPRHGIRMIWHRLDEPATVSAP